MNHSEYDVIVAGSGLGGLSVAGLLAREGMRVVVVERLDGPGGCAHAFQRGPYTFDPAVHVMGQGLNGQLVDTLLRHLGVRDEVTLLPIDPFYSAVYPDEVFAPPTGLEAYTEAHVERFPHEADGIRRFYRLCSEIHHQAHDLPPQLSLRELDEAAARFPTLFRYMRATLSELLEECLTDPLAREFCVANWPYLGLPPSKLSAVTFAQLFSTYADGLVFCRGGFQELANALVAGLERAGGELILGRTVERLTIEEGRVTGVELDGGERVRSAQIVSNVDARQTFEKLVGLEHLPDPFVRRFSRMQPTLSAFVLFTATSMDVRPYIRAHETFIYRHHDPETTYQDILAGQLGGIWINAPTLIDPSLAPTGEHLVIISALVKYDQSRPWDTLREDFTQELLSEAERVIPGLRENITYQESATPETLFEYTGNSQGAIYGWDHIPAQIGSKRLANVTPIGNLFLSGHWTQPGGGSLRALASGVQTAGIMLGRPVLPF